MHGKVGGEAIPFCGVGVIGHQIFLYPPFGLHPTKLKLKRLLNLILYIEEDSQFKLISGNTYFVMFVLNMHDILDFGSGNSLVLHVLWY